MNDLTPFEYSILESMEQRYHVPRSQVWQGSRGKQSGNVHLHTPEAVKIGRRYRQKGEALCSKKNGWYEREPLPGEQTCAECKRLALQLADERQSSW